jgi:hypothetical protein
LAPHSLLDRPVESVESEDADVLVVVGVAATLEEELNKFRDVPTEQRCLL